MNIACAPHLEHTIEVMDSQEKSTEARVVESRPAAKKPYSKPAFRFERVFETTALACGKTAPGISPNFKAGGRKSS
jgi:hypothetical protein